MEVSDPNGASPVRSGGREAATETHAGDDGGGGGGGGDGDGGGGGDDYENDYVCGDDGGK